MIWSQKIFGYHFDISLNYANSRAEFNQSGFASSVLLEDTYEVSLEYKDDVSIFRNFSMVYSLDFYQANIDTESTSAIFTEDNITQFDLGIDFKVMDDFGFIWEVGAHYKQYPFYKNTSLNTEVEHVKWLVANVGVGILTFTKFGEMTFKYNFHYGIQNDYEVDALESQTHTYYGEIGIGTPSGVGIFFEYENTEIRGAYETIHDERKVGLFKRFIW